MNCSIHLILDSSSNEEEYINCYIYDNNVDINVFTSNDNNIEELLSDENIKKEIIGYDISQLNNIYRNCSTITFQLTDNLHEFLDRNPSLLDKELIILDEVNVDREDLNKVLRAVGKYRKIKIYVSGNKKPVTIDDYEKTVVEIEKIANKIRKYNLSPLEQVMYAYDLVRDRVYVHEDENEDETISRDLTSVLFGDKIVCVGYATEFEKVLDNLGIRNLDCILYGKNVNDHGHARSAVYIKDDKYNVEGVFFFDPTWDSKEKDNPDNFLNSYKYFCRNKLEMDSYSSNYVHKTLADYNEETIWDFEDMVFNSGIASVPFEMINVFNRISNLIDGHDVISPIMRIKGNADKFNLDKVMEDLERYRELVFDANLDPKILFRVLYNVRKVEYYDNPSRYPFDIDTFRKIMINTDSNYKINNLFLYLMGISGDNTKISREDFEDIMFKLDMDKDISGTKFTRLLRTIYEKKIGEEEEKSRHR